MAVHSSRQVPGGSALFVLRLVPLIITTGHLVLGPAHRPVPAWHWVLGPLAAVLPLLCRGRPLLGLVLLNVVLVVARGFGLDAALLVVAPVAVWLVDVAAERTGRRLAPAALAAAVTVVLALVDDRLDVAQPRIWLAVAAFVAAGVGIPLLIGVNLRSARLAARRAEERAAEVERRRVSETRAARAEERTAIARELHDLVAHHVASIVLRAGVARHVVGDRDRRVAEALDDVRATGSAVLGDLRGLVAVLRDPSTANGGLGLPQPADLPDALADAVARGEQAGLVVTSSTDGGVAGLDAVRGLTVLRVVQEGLTNVLKHAGPGTTVAVRVTADDAGVRVEVADDGAGNRTALAAPGGHGLLGLRERVDLVGGALQAGPTGTGWLLTAVLPTANGPEVTR